MSCSASGTVIQSDESRSTVLSCSHNLVHRTAQDPIKIDLFDGTPHGPAEQAEKTETLPATLVAEDQQHDLAALTIHPGRVLPVSRLAAQDFQPDISSEMTVAGCRYGQAPNTFGCTVMAIGCFMPVNPIQPNTSKDYRGIMCTKSASSGRSGGGLFTAAGVLCGVLNRCTDLQGNDQPSAHSVYADPATIHRFLSRHQIKIK